MMMTVGTLLIITVMMRKKNKNMMVTMTMLKGMMVMC